jgi:hypothetical protein
LTEATIFVHVLMKTEEMTSWTPDENFSILWDALDELQSLVESTQFTGMHWEWVFLFLRVHQPIDSGHMYGSVKNGNSDPCSIHFLFHGSWETSKPSFVEVGRQK